MKPYEVIDHTADIGLMVRGRDLPSLFEHAAEGFFDLITDLKEVKGTIEKRIAIRAEPLERLMVDWLSELLYLHDVELLLFSQFHVESVGEDGLEAVVRGEPFVEGRHEIKTEVKAVTHHQIMVKESEKGWVARIIFDL
jgi:SHS2 domain-containing protein